MAGRRACGGDGGIGGRIVAERDLFGGLIRLHILHHASHEAIFGLGIIDELAHHGYKLSAGTLYPVLHSLEKAGYLISQTENTGGRQRRTYVATQEGKAALGEAKARVWELFRELFEEELQFRSQSIKKDISRSGSKSVVARQPTRKKSAAKPRK